MITHLVARQQTFSLGAIRVGVAVGVAVDGLAEKAWPAYRLVSDSDSTGWQVGTVFHCWI